jgi:hypothetical protein
VKTHGLGTLAPLDLQSKRRRDGFGLVAQRFVDRGIEHEVRHYASQDARSA